MKIFARASLSLFLAVFFISNVSSVVGQISYPRGSQSQTISQDVGDGKIEVVYHRPNVKGRTIWGAAANKPLVPYGKIWRAGANENTTFEVTQNVSVNGQKLPKGKYGFFAIPGETEWTLIFNKVNNVWGTVSPKPENDALRVKIKPESGPMQESLTYSYENVTGSTARVVLSWDKVRVPFTVDFGDVGRRLLNQVRTQRATIPIQAANYVLSSKLSANYAEAIGWVDAVANSSKPGQRNHERIVYNVGFVKSRLLAAMGKKAEAIALAAKTIEFATAENKKSTDAGGRALFNPRGIGFLKAQMDSWK